MSYDHYSRVYSSIWTEPWTEDMRTLALYLLTGPHRRTEGLYRLPLPYAAHDLRWPSKRLRAALDALLADGFAEYDETAEVVLVVKALKRNGLNGKQIAGVAKALGDLPPTSLRERFVSLAQAYNEGLAETLAAGGVSLAN